MTDLNIIKPNKYGVDESSVEPYEILIALHKRVVTTERLIGEFRNHLSNFEIELEILKNKFLELESELNSNSHS